MRGSIVRFLTEKIAQFPMASISKQILGLIGVSLLVVGVVILLHFKYGFSVTPGKRYDFL